MDSVNHIIERIYDDALVKSFESRLITIIIGPRQSGKTTSVNRLLEKINPQRKLCLNLDSSFERERIKGKENYLEEKIEELLGVKLKENSERFYLFVDEAQKLPQIFEAIKIIYDKYPFVKIILSGSSSLEILDKTAETLAGRVYTLRVSPFSMAEASLYKNIDTFDCAKTIYSHIFSPALTKKKLSKFIDEFRPKSKKKASFIETLLTRSLFPPTFSKINESEISIWLQDYIDTYIEKDMRNIKEIGNIDAYRRVIYQLAGRLGRLLEYRQLGNDAGVNQITTKKYVSIWQESLTGFLLQPFFLNLSTRIKKSKKVYFCDNALAWAMNDFKDRKILQASGEMGNYLENLVTMDFIKWGLNARFAPHFYFWEKNQACEVDLVIKTAGMVIPVEIKMSTQINKHYLQGLNMFMAKHQTKNIEIPFGLVIYNGDFLCADKNIFCLPLWLFC